MLKNNIKESIKVSRLSGKISSETSYHHGEASLEGAIINLAQDFVGSNNINLLFPDGNFGSRLLGGKDAASARYIETNLSDITSLIFNKLDTPLLQLLEDDGIEIEPEWYLPIIPMILVNGCEGIGTGYSTSIPPYNPKNLVDNILRILKNKDPLPLIPFFKNFNGEMIKDTIKENTFITKGKWEKMSDTQIKITELPVGCWVTVYKEFLESLIESNKKDIKNKKRFVLKSVENKTKDENDQICFLIEFKNGQDLETLIKSNTLEKELKLTKSINTNNMHVFSESLILTKYKTPNDILLDWYDLRLEYYDKRRNYYLKKYSDELIYLNCKIRFVTEYINKQLDINKKSKDYIIKLLEENNYNKLDNTFDYLLNLPVYSFTLEKIESLEKQVLNKQNDLDYIKNKTFKELWQIDLLELQQKL
jgi:DNA topoisomerase-2